MLKKWQRVLAVVGLAAIAGLSLGALTGGLLTGVIDGPARGRDTVELALRPTAFWLMALAYFMLTVVSVAAAYKVARHRALA